MINTHKKHERAMYLINKMKVSVMAMLLLCCGASYASSKRPPDWHDEEDALRKCRKQETGTLVIRLVNDSPKLHSQINLGGALRFTLEKQQDENRPQGNPIINCNASPIKGKSSPFFNKEKDTEYFYNLLRTLNPTN